MVLAVFLLLVGFVILIKGADFLVDGAASVAKKFNISNLAIGLTVVAFGTSMPEMVVNIISAISGKSDAAFGNVIGSNNFNLLLILGVAGTIYPLVVQRKTVKYEVPLSLIATVALYLLVNDERFLGDDSNALNRTDAVILLLLFAIFLFYIYRTMKSTLDKEEGEIKVYSTGKSAALFFAGLVMLVGGGKLVVDNAVQIAHYFGLSEKLIGLTILAAGTSLPELATSAVAAFRRNTDIAIGNVVGSNIFNICLVLGISGSISPIPFNTAINFDLYVLGVATVLLMIFMFTLNTRKLDRWEAIILLVGYLTYTLYLIDMEN
ncbi:MAG: calcium/sodium antiporter [Cyclobacteriaceae bacterium]|nr:calcium/sodium antiporter [Cyclobacteriaceae bacterium]UYN86157.1 MAG: calcium/sodium antiporter [Cyclobacteriaceae bacterium]